MSSTSETQLDALDKSLRYLLRISGDEATSTVGKRSLGIVLTDRVEKAPFVWIPVNSRLCAVWFQDSFGVGRENCVKCNLFVISHVLQGTVAPTRKRTSFIKHSPLRLTGTSSRTS